MRRNAFSSMLLLLLSMVWNVQPASAQLYQPDEEHPLITNVVADPSESQLTSNCTWKITDPGNDNYSYNQVYIDAGNELGALIDNDETTYWHSDPTGPNLNTQDLYIQVDLKRTDIQRFYYQYNRRGDVYNGSVRRGILWTKLEIKATNTPEDNASWVTVALHSDLPLQSDDNATWPYTPPMVEMSQAYRYLRFYARYASGNGYWCMSEFQMYPAQEVTDPFAKLTSLLDSTDPGAFEVGTDPGYYAEDKAKVFEEEWTKAYNLSNNSSATAAQLEAAEKSLRQALEDVKASRIPVTDGYYRFVSSYAGFMEQQGVEKAIISNTLEKRMNWGDLDEDSPYQVFKVTTLPGGTYSIQCVGNQKYIDWVAGDACNTAAAYNLAITDEQKTGQIIFADTEHLKPWFSLYNEKNSCTYHMLSHGNGAGTSGYLCAAGVGYNECNYWYMRRVDDATAEALGQEGMKTTYANLLAQAIEKAESVRKKANDYEALIYEANDEDDEHNQFSSNARWTYKDAATGGQGAYANLIDGSSDTYFHSRYPASAVAGYHYLQVDLKRTDISEFIFKMLRRGDGGWRDSWNQLPNDIEVWVTNDASAVEEPTPTSDEEAAASAWKKVVHLNSGFPAMSSHEYYTSPIVNMSGSYQYVRFVMLNTVNGPGYFNMSEFQMYATTPTQSSEYYTVKGMKEVCDQMDTELAKAKEKVENLTAEKGDTAILNELARQINALYVDRAGINRVLSNYLTTATATYKTAFSYDNLLTEASQITSNAPISGTDYAWLIDNNLGTYYQSDQTGELNKSSVYLQVDLGRDDLSEVNFEFYGISANWWNPNSLDIYVSDQADDESSWKRLTGLTEGFDTNKPNAHYVSPNLNLGAPHRYIRLYPLGSDTDDFNINMAELQFHSTTPSTEKSQYYYVEGLKDAADNLKAVIDRVQDKVNKGMAVDLSDTAAITAATAAVKALVFDPTEYNSLASDAALLLADTYNVGNCVGQYPASAVETLKGALDKANGMIDYDKVDRQAFEAATTLLTEAKAAFLATQVSVDTHTWYNIKFPSEEYFESRGWDVPSWWAISNPFYDQYIAPGLRGEDMAEILSSEDVSAGDHIYYFSQDDVASEPTAAQWRFVEVSKGKYALQNRLSGLFIHSGTGSSSTTMQLTPSLATVKPLGYGQCAIDLCDITGASLGTYHYLNGQGNEVANQLGTWSAVSTAQQDNSLFIIEPVEAIDEASYAPSFVLSQFTGDHTPLCFATEIKAIDGMTAYTAAGTLEKDGTKYIALTEAEMPIKAGQPFFLISDEVYDGECAEDVHVTPGSDIVTKPGSKNGLTGVFTRTLLDEGLVWIGATEAKAVDNVTTATEAGSAYMKYGYHMLSAANEYDKLLPISGTPRDFNDYDLDQHEGTKDDPYPISSAMELMALHSAMRTGQMTYAILDEDIDMSGEDWEPLNWENNSVAGGKSFMNWIDLDGRGHVISNLTSKGHRYAGVFGVLCGSLRNVGFENVNVNCTETGSGVLGGYVGHGNFTDAAGNKQTTTVENVWVTGQLHVASSYCGGMFGNVGGPTVIKNCYTNLEVSSEASLVGGLVGRVSDALTVENVYVAGTCTGAGVTGGCKDGAPASKYQNVVVWNNTESNFGSTAAADSKSGISFYDGSNFAALQETVVGWGREWYCDMQEGSYPTLIANGMRLLLDVVFNEDGTASDASPLHSSVEILGSTPTTYWSDAFNRYVARFDAQMGATPEGIYKVDFENNSTFSKALANGHSLEMVIKAEYEGDAITSVTKPFSAMQAGGTGFETANVGGQYILRFNPNVSTNGESNWGRVDSHLSPKANVFYHVVGVWDKQQQKAFVYVNGQKDGEAELPGSFHFPNKGCGWFGIGGDPSPGNKSTNAWQGDIVIARVYNDALTASEVSTLYNDMKGGTGLDGVKASASQDDAIFTINGIRVQKTQKGIYIINGKKVMAK